MDTGPGIWEYRAFGQEERTSFSRILRPIGVLMIGKPGVSWKFDKGLVGVKLKVHEGDRSPSAEIQNAGSLRFNTQIYEENYGFQVDYRYHNRVSLSLFHLSLSLSKARAIYASASGKGSYSGSDFVCTKLLDGQKEGS